MVLPISNDNSGLKLSLAIKKIEWFTGLWKNQKILIYLIIYNDNSEFIFLSDNSEKNLKIF